MVQSQKNKYLKKTVESETEKSGNGLYSKL